MDRRPVVFGYPRIVRLAPIAALFIAAGGFALTLGGDTAHADRLTFLGGAAVALAIGLILRTRIELGADAIVAVGPWTSRRMRRDEIAAVAWESGSRVVLDLRNGGQVMLPRVAGRDGDVAGTIHGWLQEERTP